MSASVPVKAGVAAAPRPHLGGSESGDPVVDVFIVVPKLVLSEPHPLHRLGGRAANETACGGGGGDGHVGVSPRVVRRLPKWVRLGAWA